jgi:branched-chain amino acid aminotransferase
MWVRLNEELIPAEDAKISIFDRGFMYGDGVFETMRAYHGRVFRLESHVTRFRQSAMSLEIALPYSSEEIAAHIHDVLGKNGLEDAVIRISITRGRGSRGSAIAVSSTPTYLVVLYTLPDDLVEREQHGISLAIVDIRRSSPETLPAHTKHSNYLNPILANMQALRAGADEALMLSVSGHLAECAASNVFLVRESWLLTPCLETGILPGITRAASIEIARREGMTVKELWLPPDVLKGAREVFVTNSVVGILPVRRVDHREFQVKGPVTGRLMELYREAVEAETRS